MDWHYYVNPDRNGKGPFLWGCRIDGKTMRRMNSIPEDPSPTASDLDAVVLTNPLVDPEPMKKVTEKTDKGYVYALKVKNLSDVQAVAVGTFLTVAARRIYRGIAIESGPLWDLVVGFIKTEMDPGEDEVWEDIPPEVLQEVFASAWAFCDLHIGKAKDIAKKGAFVVSKAVSIAAVPLEQIVQSFQFKEGAVSPIW